MSNQSETDLLRQILKKLDGMPDDPRGQWLSPDEMAALRTILPFGEEIVRFFGWRRALRVVTSRGRAQLVAMVAVVGLFITFREQVHEVAQWFAKK